MEQPIFITDFTDIREKSESGKTGQCLVKEYGGSLATTLTLAMRFAVETHFHFRKRMQYGPELIRSAEVSHSHLPSRAGTYLHWF